MKIIADEEFISRFRDGIGCDDCMYAFKGVMATTCRTVEMYKMWKDGSSLDNIIEMEWEINFDLCFDDGDADTCYFPQSAYDFCKKVVETLDSEFCDDRE